MLLKNLISACNYKLLTNEADLEKEVTGVYCCDLLSLVMGRAFSGCCWVTVMANINSLAVASLSDTSCIIFAEGVKPEENLIAKANEQGICILCSEDKIFETALQVHQTLGLK